MLPSKTSPLTPREARHLLGRAKLSANLREIEEATGRLAQDVVRDWISAPRNSWFLRDPPWMVSLYPPTGSSTDEVRAFLDTNEYYVAEVRATWLGELLAGDFRNRMALLWHDHFVTDVAKYRYAPLAFRYVRLIQAHGLGDFRRFVKAIATEGAMLYYLDGRYSTRSAPNENFARELMELFTMGQWDADGNRNYTQEDIAEAARALTGWRMNVRSSWSSYFSRSQFDPSEKTFLGRTGVFGTDEVVDVLFEERGEQIARFITRKLMSVLAHPEPADEAVDDAARYFVESGFDTGALVTMLLSSEWFYDERFTGTRVKEPVELMSMMFSMADRRPDEGSAVQALTQADQLSQEVLSPPNVAGWPGHHAWLNTDLLPRRWRASEWLAGFAMTQSDWAALAQRLIPLESTHPAVDFALGLADLMFAVPLEHVSIPEVEEPFGGDLVNAPLPDDLLNGPAHRIQLVKLMLAGTPWYEWSLESGAGVPLVIHYVRELSRLPEYQLN